MGFAIVNISPEEKAAADAARARVNRIRSHVEDIKSEIVAAYRERDWDALGYDSWEEYCSAEFGGTIELPRSEREPLHFALREHGLSTRAIAAVTGVHKDTVNEDIKRQLAENPPVDLPPTLGRDGRTRKSPKKERVRAQVVAQRRPVSLALTVNGRTMPIECSRGLSEEAADRLVAALQACVNAFVAELSNGGDEQC